ncbi:MAG: putative DNA binding domain-containing protein [Deltaproteobacteria bacterium]|nr:putative DNA binding domain-containing protein [Deltaproteobacteria bacterium]
MITGDLQNKLDQLLRLDSETEWVEFKRNNDKPEEIGEYLSAISNGAALHGKKFGYIVWGVEAGTHKVVGTTFQPKRRKIGGEELENWLLRLLTPRIDFTIHAFERSQLPVVLFEIQAANSTPVRFKQEAFIRVGSYKKKLKDFPEKERKLWNILSNTQADWSAEFVEGAGLDDLDPQAIQFARVQYQKKYPHQTAELSGWDDATFLNKAKVCIGSKLTHAALLLLGKEESTHFLSPSQVRITWVLRDENNIEKDYQHFTAPLILASDQLLGKIRNLTIRHLPSGTLFPHEITQYDPWVIRETLHNCVAHQDYSAGGRINVVETPESLLFTNLGSFIPGTVEEMIRSDAPPEVYRNPFLAQAMVNLNMIDTIGSGIKRMFTLQRQRSFPMPDYELSDPNKVAVRLTGRVLDENYTRLLMSQAELDLMDVIAMDKVQKKQPLDDETFKRLKALKLIEGRRPNIFVSAKIADVTGDRAAYIKNRAFDKGHYKEMIVAYLQKFGESTRSDLDGLLLEKLSDALDGQQKKRYITNLLQEMKKEGHIFPDGTTRWAKWRISKPRAKGDV